MDNRILRIKLKCVYLNELLVLEPMHLASDMFQRTDHHMLIKSRLVVVMNAARFVAIRLRKYAGILVLAQIDKLAQLHATMSPIPAFNIKTKNFGFQ